MKNKSKTISFLGLCTALALVLAYLEAIIPPVFPSVPGIKMGLPNIVLIFVLYRKGGGAAMVVSMLRIVLVSVLFGNGMSLLYSLAGGLLSMSVMILLKRSNLLSTVGVSVAGGVMHNVGQILMAMLLLETTELIYYLVILAVSGTIAGILIGLCGASMVRKIPEF